MNYLIKTNASLASKPTVYYFNKLNQVFGIMHAKKCPQRLLNQMRESREMKRYR